MNKKDNVHYIISKRSDTKGKQAYNSSIEFKDNVLKLKKTNIDTPKEKICKDVLAYASKLSW